MKRGRTTREIPPPLELACLKELWELGEGNVQAVKERLAPKRNLAYTTVMTMLDRLVRKQAVTRRKVGRSFVYTPLISREEIRRMAVRELIESLFGGTRENLAQWLAGKAVEEIQPSGAEDIESAIDTTLL